MSKRKFEESIEASSEKGQCNDDKEVEQVTFFASASTDGLGSFAKMPAELMEEICSNLGSKDILNMTLTSKAMNMAISLNAHIMARIKLTFPNSEIRTGSSSDFFGQRIYPSIKYKPHTIKDFKLFGDYMADIGHGVKTIEFATGLSYTAAVNVLKLLPNIKSVMNFPARALTTATRRPQYQRQMSAKGIENKLKADPTPLPLDLKTLILKSAESELNLFGSCHKLEYFSVEQALGVVAKVRLARFVLAQQSLRSLSVPYSQEFFNSFEQSTSSFKLMELKIEFGQYQSYGQNEPHDSFERFVKKHRETLQSLTVPNMDFLVAVQDFVMLKEVKLILTDGSPYAESEFSCPLMSFVEKLDVLFESRHQMTSNWRTFPILYMRFNSLGHFPCLKEFNAKKLRTNRQWTHDGIERICLDTCDFRELDLPNLKSAKFINIDFVNRRLKNFDNIIEVVFEKCTNVENWLTSLVQRPETKLRKIRLSNMNVTVASRQLLEQFGTVR